MNYAVIEFTRNNGGFENGGMQHHGHFATEQEATAHADNLAATSTNRVTVLPLLNASAYLD